jgi:hypothetical protein
VLLYPARDDRDMVYLEDLDGNLEFSILDENDDLTLLELIEP